MITKEAEQWARINQYVAKQVATEERSTEERNTSDVFLAYEAIERLDLPKAPIAWLASKVHDKAEAAFASGDIAKATELFARENYLRALYGKARIETHGDKPLNWSELDRKLAESPVSKAQARAGLKRILAKAAA